MNRPSRDPKQLITREFAKQLHQNYRRTRTRLIENEIKKEDANAIWFSLEELENYINYIKVEARKDGYQANGIHFYFGAYPEEAKYEEKAGLTTLFLNATGKKISVQTPPHAKMQNLTLSRQDEGTVDIQSVAPMNYGNIGRPPSIVY